MNDLVKMVFHPTIAVGDLEEARTWFRRLFLREDVRWEDRYDLSLLNNDYPQNYSFFMNVADVVLDALSPAMHAQGALKGQDRFKGITEGMIGIGWYTDDMMGLIQQLRKKGIHCHDQQSRELFGDVPPASAMAPDVLLAFTDPAMTGFRYEFFQLGERHRPYYSQKGDPRLREDWTLPALSTEDPLSIVRGSHHTFVTHDLDRALRVHCDALGGRVVGEGTNGELNSDSTFIDVADSIFEFAVPRPGSRAYNLASPDMDSYVGLTFITADLRKVEDHLRGLALGFSSSENSLTIQPADGFGVAWRFSTHELAF
jgi:catechol 2,3-dioxygenase-like lactoylglutathione lyase family enzyme